MLEKTFDSPLDCQEIKAVNPQGNQPCIFIGSTDAEAEAPILQPLDVKNWLFGKDPDARKDWRQEEKTEDEVVGWHHWVNGHEFEQAPGASEGQGSLVCCRPCGHKELDMTEQLNKEKDNSYWWRRQMIGPIFIKHNWGLKSRTENLIYFEKLLQESMEEPGYIGAFPTKTR